MKTTKNGSKLAASLNPVIGSTPAISHTCSLICRLAPTYARIQEAWCNGVEESQEAALREREAELERRIADLVANLPHTEEGPIRVGFTGDPRGATIKLVLPGSLERYHDDWGRVGICVPGA